MNIYFSLFLSFLSISIPFCLSPSLCLERMDDKSCLNILNEFSLDLGSANRDRLCKP